MMAHDSAYSCYGSSGLWVASYPPWNWFGRDLQVPVCSHCTCFYALVWVSPFMSVSLDSLWLCVILFPSHMLSSHCVSDLGPFMLWQADWHKFWHSRLCKQIIFIKHIIMHHSMASGDAYPIINHHCDDDAAQAHPHCPLALTRMIMACRLMQINTCLVISIVLQIEDVLYACFPTDVLGLCDACALHGVLPKLLDDNEHCFSWLVSHLFRGDCTCPEWSSHQIVWRLSLCGG